MIKQTGDKNIAIGKNEGQIHFHFNINNIDPKQYGTLIEELTQDLQRQNSEIEKRENTIEIHEETIKELREIKKSLKAEKEEIQAQLKDKSETISETEAQNKLAEIEQKAHEIQKQLDQKSQKITTLETKNRQLRLDLLHKSHEINQLNARIKSLEETKVQATKFLEKENITDSKVKKGLEFIQNDEAYKIDELLSEKELIDEETKVREKQKQLSRPLARKYLVKAFGATAEFDFKKAETYHKKAFEICPDAEFWFEYAHFMQANFSDNQIVIEYYKKALQQVEEQSNDKMVAMISYYLGRAYISTYKYSKAESYYLKSLKIYQDSNSKEDIGRMFVQLGDLYSENVDMDNQKALQHYDEAFKIFVSNVDDYLPIMGDIFNSLGVLYKRYGKEKYPIAKECLQLAIRIRSKLAKQNEEIYTTLLLDSYYNLGVLEYRNQQYEEALNTLGMVLQEYNRYVYKNPKLYAFRIVTVLIVIGEIKIQQKEAGRALLVIGEARRNCEVLAIESPDLFHLELIKTDIMLCKVCKLFVEKGELDYILLAKNILHEIAPKLEKNKDTGLVKKLIEQELTPLLNFFMP